MILESISGALLGPKGMRLNAYNHHSIEKNGVHLILLDDIDFMIAK